MRCATRHAHDARADARPLPFHFAIELSMPTQRQVRCDRRPGCLGRQPVPPALSCRGGTLPRLPRPMFEAHCEVFALPTEFMTQRLLGYVEWVANVVLACNYRLGDVLVECHGGSGNRTLLEGVCVRRLLDAASAYRVCAARGCDIPVRFLMFVPRCISLFEGSCCRNARFVPLSVIECIAHVSLVSVSLSRAPL